MTTTAYKVTTHDLRPPVRGGDPIWDGTLPYTLPPVTVDTSTDECAGGWNACADAATALRVAGLWPNGRPSRPFVVETDAAVIARGDKLRAATWTIVRECSDVEVCAAIRVMSTPFGDLRDEMIAEQIAWRTALARPGRDPAAVEAGLRLALGARGLATWTLRRYDTAWTAWTAWDAWGAMAARGAGAAWDAGDARAARDALSVYHAARRGWIEHEPALLTVGLRDAYAAGLAVAVPVADGVLGWAMESSPAHGQEVRRG